MNPGLPPSNIWPDRRRHFDCDRCQQLAEVKQKSRPTPLFERPTVRDILSSKIASLLEDCRAVSAVEFAITAPLLIGMLIPLVDLGLGIAKNTQLHNAAHAGAQYALVNGWDNTAIRSAVTNATNLSPIEALPAPSQSCGCPTGTAVTQVTCGSVCSDGSNAGTYVTVNARSSYVPVIQYPMLGSSFTLVATSIVRINQ